MCIQGNADGPAPDGLDQTLERALLALRRAPPLVQLAAVPDVVLMLGSIATDLRNAKRASERELAELQARVRALELAGEGR